MPAPGIEPVLYRYNRILSPARLPVPPRRHNIILDNIQWAEVDSNHRSKLQQIYSLSPLATRESAHSVRTNVLTRKNYNIVKSIMQDVFYFLRHFLRRYNLHTMREIAAHSCSYFNTTAECGIIVTVTLPSSTG